MSIKVISGNTKIKQVTVGSPVRIIRRIAASDFEFGSLNGIDLTGVTDGAMLVYNSATENFESKVNITNANTTFNGGNF
jgi:hypothetical protein